MNFETSRNSYSLLSSVADELFMKCEDNPDCIAGELERMDPALRDQLLVSDLLNAWQVFYYYFREDPGPDIREILAFIPAGSLPHGAHIGEIGVFGLTFAVEQTTPVIMITDDERVLERFSGKKAFHEVRVYVEENY